jgi:hypothetical protein
MISNLSSYQQVKLLSAIQTSLRFIPLAMAGLFINVVIGYLMGRVSGQLLILAGLVASVVRADNFDDLVSIFIMNIYLSGCTLNLCIGQRGVVILGDDVPSHDFYW